MGGAINFSRSLTKLPQIQHSAYVLTTETFATNMASSRSSQNFLKHYRHWFYSSTICKICVPDLKLAVKKNENSWFTAHSYS